MASENLLHRVAAMVILLSSAKHAFAGTPVACPNTGVLSCMNSTTVEDLCCFNAPGGQLLQTQFWDTNPVSGPVDSWTVHGLWPDRCDGTYDANCDDTRAYTNITDILRSFGKTDLLSYMHTYWPDYQGNDESFWEHEWSKHGTCISTLKPSCYSEYVPTQEVPDFFQKTVDLFKTLPSYQWLAEAGITPSSSATYTSAQIEAALSAHHDNYNVTIGCSSGALTEIWYHYYVSGNIQTGNFVAASPDGTKSTCPDTGVKYLPKLPSTSSTATVSLASTTRTSSVAVVTATGDPFSGRGYLNVILPDSKEQKGCLISGGTWFTTGTCATYTATTVPGHKAFTLRSSKGYCGVIATAFVCAGFNTPANATVFTRDNHHLKSDVGIRWSADAVPAGSQQTKVFSNNKDVVQIRVEWQSI